VYKAVSDDEVDVRLFEKEVVEVVLVGIKLVSAILTIMEFVKLKLIGEVLLDVELCDTGVIDVEFDDRLIDITLVVVVVNRVEFEDVRLDEVVADMSKLDTFVVVVHVTELLAIIVESMTLAALVKLDGIVKLFKAVPMDDTVGDIADDELTYVKLVIFVEFIRVKLVDSLMVEDGVQLMVADEDTWITLV